MFHRRITLASYFADILIDQRGPANQWIYVVQRSGSPEILALGSCATEEEAQEEARRAVMHFALADFARAKAAAS